MCVCDLCSVYDCYSVCVCKCVGVICVVCTIAILSVCVCVCVCVCENAFKCVSMRTTPDEIVLVRERECGVLCLDSGSLAGRGLFKHASLSLSLLLSSSFSLSPALSLSFSLPLSPALSLSYSLSLS